MFSNGLFAFHPFPGTHEEFPQMGRRSRDWMRDESLMGRGPVDLVDKWMEILEPWSTGSLVGEPSPWNRPRTRCCPHNCLLDYPQRTPRRPPSESHQHLVILPNLFATPIRSDQQEGGAQQKESGTACSHQCKEKDTASSDQTAESKDAVGSISSGSGDTSKSPWHFSVDMSGCDEVRAVTDKGMLMVEGRGSSDTSQQMVRYITSLPRHVSHNSLTAMLNNGRLTVSQKAEPNQQGSQARMVPIDVQQQKKPEPAEQQQQQQQSDAADKEQ